MNHELTSTLRNAEQDEVTKRISEKIDISCAEHQSWGNNCNAWTLLQTNNLSVLEECMPPQTSDEMHYHMKSDQFLYVLDGEVTINMENNLIALEKNQGIQIPAGTPHCVLNRSEKNTRFLLISSPDHRNDRVLTGDSKSF